MPAHLQPKLGIDAWQWVDDLVGSGTGVLDRAAGLLADDVAVLNQLIEEMLEAFRNREVQRVGTVDRYSRIKQTVLNRELLGAFGSSNVLPKYSFPVDVVELQTNHIPDDIARSVTLSRDLRQALTDYAPGSEAVAGGRVWVSGGVKLPYHGRWDTWEYAVCPACLAFVRSRASIPAACPSCSGSLDRPYRGMGGTYIVPEFGFVASQREVRRPGETRPQRIYSSQVFFTHDQAEGKMPEASPSEHTEGFSVTSSRGVRARYSRNGRLSVVNSGLMGRGFRVCDHCGFAEPAPLPTGREQRRTSRPKHHDPRYGRECGGRLTTYHLGHTFESDVLALDFPGIPLDRMRALSLLYAVLAGGCQAIGIQADDVDGLVYGSGASGHTLVLFDTVPGGAGHVQRIGRNLDGALRGALERVSRCSCGEETSCYECLRSYRNQFVHQELSRGAAHGVLERLVI